MKLDDETSFNMIFMICYMKFTFYIIYNKTISNKKAEGKFTTESIR
jgi:hypothetical protein